MNKLIEKIKSHPDYHKAGMILCHNGVVRGTSRDGRRVSGILVKVDHDKLKKIIDERKKDAGIIEILIEIEENRKLSVGEDVMKLIVAGDIRTNVIATFTETLEAVKTTVTHKTEFFIEKTLA